MEQIRLYSPITDVRTVTFPLHYSWTHYELLSPDPERKGHSTRNSGRVPVTVYFGLELVGLYPPWGDIFRLVLQPGDFYLGDVGDIIPLAGSWLEISDKFGLAELTIAEFF